MNKENGKYEIPLEDYATCRSDEKIILGEEKEAPKKKLLYNILEIPPWYTCILLGFQHYMAMFIGNLAVPFLLSDALCMKGDPTVKMEITGVQFFVCGFITLCQVLLGVRLPIVQGSTFSLLIPTLSFLNLPKNECPFIADNCTDVTGNVTCIEKGTDAYHDVWQSRMVTIQGSIMVASLLEILLGFSGCIGLLLRYIGPLVICPTITLVGVSLFGKAASYASHNWLVFAMTLLFLVLFSQYLSVLKIPFPTYQPKRGCGKTRFPFFKMFPVVLAVMISWVVCSILTMTDAIPNDPTHWAYGGRTDLHAEVLAQAPWFSFFWPCKYGVPKVDISLVLGLLAGYMASITESVGDYHACARMACAPPPPKHAINRGITVEGLGCLLAGLFGTGNGTTSTSQNIGIIGLTRVGSPVVILYTGCIMILFAVFNKFGAYFVTVPVPIVGAAFTILFGMVVAVGLSNLQHVDMNSPRNLFVMGFSFFFGLSLSEYVKAHPQAFNTNIEMLDSVITVLLSTSMFVGGVLAFILDNTIPGTRQERGMRDYDEKQDEAEEAILRKVYDLPCIRRKVKCLSYLPVCPP